LTPSAFAQINNQAGHNDNIVDLSPKQKMISFIGVAFNIAI